MKAELVSVLTGLQSLSNDDSRERPVDRLHALGSSQRPEEWDETFQRVLGVGQQAHLCALGKDLISAKFCNNFNAREKATWGLADALKWEKLRLRLNHDQRMSTARWSVHEWVFEVCGTCTGRGTLPDHNIKNLEGIQPMKACVECGGSGKRRYEDSERREFLGDTARLEKALATAQGLIGTAERMAVRSARELLERW